MDRQQQEIRQIYDEYLTETERLETNRKATDGLLGFGRGPGTDACHDRFSERLEQMLGSIVTAAPSSQSARQVLEFIFRAPIKNKKNTLAYWMLQAVHALTENMIDFLSQEDAAFLAALYKDAYPKSTRLPAQKKIAVLLLKRAGVSSQRKGSIWDKVSRRGRSK